MSSKFTAWLRQPTTVHAIAALAATVAGLATWFASHNSAAVLGAIGSTFALFAGALPDNSADKSKAEVSDLATLVNDAITAITDQRVRPVLAADVTREIKNILAAPTIAAPAQAPVQANVATAVLQVAGPATP